MGPADPIQEALRHQGLHLGQQANEIASLSRGMEVMSNQLTQLSEAWIQTLATPPAPASPPRPVPGFSSEPRLPAPERYDGDPGQCRYFLATCSLVFKLQPSSFQSERSRVSYVLTLLSGRVPEWGTAMWEAKAPDCQNFSSFGNAMKGVFGRSVTGPAATRQLFRIRQGSRSVADYAIEFCTLAASASWGEKELIGAFYNGLGENLLDELNTCNLPFLGWIGGPFHPD